MVDTAHCGTRGAPEQEDYRVCLRLENMIYSHFVFMEMKLISTIYSHHSILGPRIGFTLHDHMFTVPTHSK